MDKYQKILTAFVIFMTALLITGIVLLTMLLNKPKDIQVNNILGGKGDSAYQIAQKHGFTGDEVQWLNSLVGAKGEDSVSTQTIKVVETSQPSQPIVTTIMGSTGRTGDTGATGGKGDTGEAGKKQITWFDKETCTLYTKYEGDRFWEELNKFPSPCTVEE